MTGFVRRFYDTAIHGYYGMAIVYGLNEILMKVHRSHSLPSKFSLLR